MNDREHRLRAARRGGPPGLVYLVPTSHLDTQWRWTVRDTIRDFLPRTLDENFALFDRLPEFTLSFEGAFRYRLIQEYYPAEFERLRRRVEEGRWRVAGAMLDAPDVNIPSPESLIRHHLYGRRFFERELGVAGEDVFLPDCFGFGWAMPSIAAHCGLRGLSTSKLVRWKAPDEAPFRIGRWRGPDGAEIVAVLHPEGYGEGVSEDLSRAGRWRRRIEALGRQCGAPVAMMYAGVGDRGGALDEASTNWLKRSLEGDGPVEVRMAGSDELFRDLPSEAVARLPVHEDELLLPTHGTGCLTSQAALKRWNRQNERLADAAERAAVAAWWLGARDYPEATLRESWERFLWHQMHDDLTGTSIPEAVEISWNDEAIALNRFAGVLADSVGAVAGALDTRVEGVPLVVYNPLAAAREDVVEARVRFGGGAPAAARVFDGEGREVPSQVVGAEGEALDLVFLARVPPVGFAVFDVRPAEAPCGLPSTVSATAEGLENERYRARLDAHGDLAGLYDKKLERELLAAPSRVELLRDRSARWPAWEILWEDIEAPPVGRFGGGRSGKGISARVDESGPARATIEVTRRHGRSRLVQRLSLAAGDAGHRLEVHNDLDWQTRGRLAKAVFRAALSDPRATYDLGLGAIERGVNRRERYEVPAQAWADLTAGDGSAGLSILSDGRSGWDRPREDTLRLSLARSPRVIRKFRHQGIQDLGPHRFAYALYGHRGDRADGGTAAEAARFCQPLRAFQVTPGEGRRGRWWSLARVEPASVALRALKLREDGDDLVIRLQETAGRPVERAVVVTAAPLADLRAADGTERPLGETSERGTDGAADPASARFEGEGAPASTGDDEGAPLGAPLGAFAPATWLARMARPADRLSPPASHPLPLPLDRAAASFHAAGGAVDFDGQGRSLAGELLPPSLVFGGARLDLAATDPDAFHCLSCDGQALAAPAGDGRELLLLACAVGGRQRGEIRLGERRHELSVADWTAPVGGWVRRRQWQGLTLGRPRPPFLVRDPIAWVGGHRHDREVRDEVYRPTLLFAYRLALPAGARTIVLPREPRIRVFAATVTTGGAGPARPCRPLYD